MQKIARVLLAICFAGLAILQIQYPKEALNNTQNKFNAFVKFAPQLGLQKMTDASAATSVVSCSALKLFVALCVLFKYRIGKYFGILYLLSAIVIVGNPFIYGIQAALPLIGLLGALLQV